MTAITVKQAKTVEVQIGAILCALDKLEEIKDQDPIIHDPSWFDAIADLLLVTRSALHRFSDKVLP